MNRICSICELPLPATDEYFYSFVSKVNGKRYLRHTCKECELAKQARRDFKHRFEISEKRRKKRLTDRDNRA